MKRDVQISFQGIQIDETGSENSIISTSKGVYSFKDGTHCICYKEHGGINSKSELKISNKRLSLIRYGEIATQIVFEKGKRNQIEYNTPYGKIKMDVATNQIVMQENKNNLQIVLEYILMINESPAFKNILRIEISEETGINNS